MSAPGQAAAFRAGGRRSDPDTWPWPPALRPLRDQFGADVALLGGLSSGTETRRGARLLRAAAALFLPLGRMRYDDGRLALFGHQVVFLGTDLAAFRRAVEALRDPRRPLLPMRGVL